MTVPDPTPIYRFIHMDNLEVYLRRGGAHAPNHTPNDGLVFRTIHNEDIQAERRTRQIPCGPRGVIHDYVSFYFGYHSPMLLQLKTGQVPGFDEGQEPLVHLVSTAQEIGERGARFVFSDGHGIAAYTSWYHDLADLDKVDWPTVGLRYWKSTIDDMDRKRRKQAEFLVYRFCDWTLINEIGVINAKMKAIVEEILRRFPAQNQPVVTVRRGWYY
jgi:hypothetical protein